MKSGKLKAEKYQGGAQNVDPQKPVGYLPQPWGKPVGQPLAEPSYDPAGPPPPANPHLDWLHSKNMANIAQGNALRYRAGGMQMGAIGDVSAPLGTMPQPASFGPPQAGGQIGQGNRGPILGDIGFGQNPNLPMNQQPGAGGQPSMPSMNQAQMNYFKNQGQLPPALGGPAQAMRSSSFYPPNRAREGTSSADWAVEVAARATGAVECARDSSHLEGGQKRLWGRSGVDESVQGLGVHVTVWWRRDKRVNAAGGFRRGERHRVSALVAPG